MLTCGVFSTRNAAPPVRLNTQDRNYLLEDRKAAPNLVTVSA